MSAAHDIPAAKRYGEPLTEADYRTLAESYITREVADSAMLRRVSNEQGKVIVGRRNYEDYAGIVFPYRWPDDPGLRAHRLRRDNPPVEIKRGVEKESDKYLSALGWGNPLYFHPDTPASALSDISVDLYFTEGQKKCLALYRLFRDKNWVAQPVALNGVWGFLGRTGISINKNGKRVPDKGLIPDFARIVWDGRRVFIIFDSNAESDWLVGAARNELALELTRLGAKVELIDMEPEPGVNGIDDYLGKHGKEAGLELIAKARPFDPSEKIAKLAYTDYGHEQAFEYLHGKDFLYNHTKHQWHVWNGVIWEPDTTKQVDRAMLAVAIARKDAAAKEADEKKRKTAVKAAIKLQNVNARKSALESAQSNSTFAKTSEDFDRHEMLFACANGVLNLNTGEFGSGRRGDLLTLQTEVEWNPIAQCPAWLNFLRQVFPEDTDAMITFLQRAVGYSMTGLTREEVFFIMHGSGGRNGKGMGMVYLAERSDGAFKMTVAVKVVPLALASLDIEERFRRERQFLASLDHPKVARLIDGGVTSAGLPYLVMDFVDGLAIDRFCDTQKQDARARILLMRQVLEALTYVHGRQVIHRDLKASNILVDAASGFFSIENFGP